MTEPSYVLVRIPEERISEVAAVLEDYRSKGFESFVVHPQQSLFHTRQDWEAVNTAHSAGHDREQMSENGIELSAPIEIIPEVVDPIPLRLHVFRDRGLVVVDVIGTSDFERAKNFASPELAGMDWKHEINEDLTFVRFIEFPVEG